MPHINTVGEVIKIGESTTPYHINQMCLFIKEHGEAAFLAAVFHGAFSEYSDDYVHPINALRETKDFNTIQRAFINAYT